MGKSASSKEPSSASKKAADIITLRLYFSIRIPVGKETSPYAIKKAKGRSATIKRLSLKSLIISGVSGPIIFVINEITKKVSITRNTVA